MQALEGYRTIALQVLGALFSLLAVFGLDVPEDLKVQLLALVNGALIPAIAIYLRFKTKAPVGEKSSDR